MDAGRLLERSPLNLERQRCAAPGSASCRVRGPLPPAPSYRRLRARRAGMRSQSMAICKCAWSGCGRRARGPLPAVIVHPEAGHQAADMRGVLHDSGARRAIWRSPPTTSAARALAGARASFRGGIRPIRGGSSIGCARHPDVDPRRVRAPRLLAGRRVQPPHQPAYDGGAAAVVAYYPVTDFESWLEAAGAGLGRTARFSRDPRRLPPRQRRAERRRVAGAATAGLAAASG